MSINEWESRSKIEISRVVFFRSSNSHWIVQHHPDKGTDDQVWEEDNILRIQRVGKWLSNKLRMSRINTVKDLQNLPNKRVDELSASGISQEMLASAIRKIQNTNPGAYENPLTDRRTKDNPYVSLYPNDHENILGVVCHEVMCVHQGSSTIHHIGVSAFYARYST